MSAIEIEEGMVFGYLTVVDLEYLHSNGGATWFCRCVCGKELVVQGRLLKSEPTVNCGCQTERLKIAARTKHGNAQVGKLSTEYRRWVSMKQRCLNPNFDQYVDYGGRGIKVCDRWVESFENFLADMGECPKGFTLDRLEVDGDYSPDNCQWSAFADQQRNKRNTVWVEWQGKKVQLRSLSEEFGLPRSRVYQQWKRGVPLETIFQPPKSF